MRCARFGLLFLILATALAACAQPAALPVAPVGECNASRTVCESVVVTPPIRAEPPDLPLSAPQTSDGLRFQARLVFNNPSLGDAPTTLRALVTVENPTPETVALNMGACQFTLSAYERPERPSGSRVAQATFEDTCYFSDALEPLPDGTYVLRLEPGSSLPLWFDLNDYFLSSELADGRYDFDLKLVLSEHRLTFAVGSADVRFSVPNLAYRAVTENVRSGNLAQLRAAVVVENRNREPVLLTYGHCALVVRLYQTAEGTGTPVYSRSVSPDGSCLGYLASSEVSPGGSLRADEFEVLIPVSEIEGAVAPGYYYVRLSLELDWRATPVDAGVLAVRCTVGLPPLAASDTRPFARAALTDDATGVSAGGSGTYDERKPVYRPRSLSTYPDPQRHIPTRPIGGGARSCGALP